MSFTSNLRALRQASVWSGRAGFGPQRVRSRRPLQLEPLENRCVPAAGALDATFDFDGKVTTDFGFTGERAPAVVVQSDGKIVLAGNSYSGGAGYRFALARYDTSGSLDTSFGNGGKVTTDFGSFDNVATGVAVQSDGKIVVAGYSDQGTTTGYDFALARYDANGSPDTSFGTGGKVTTDFGSLSDQANGVAIQSDGKVVVAGHSYLSNRPVFALARYNGNGSLDSSFGTGGKLISVLDNSRNDIQSNVSGVTVQTDGKIVAVGGSYYPGNGSFLTVARYNGNGSLDSSFGTGGWFLDFSGNSAATAVAVQSDGKIVVAGTDYHGYPTFWDFILARYNADGSPDISFDTDGHVFTDFGSTDDYANGVAVQSDGQILVAGYSDQSTTGNDFTLARYNANGSLDTSFGSGGKVTTDFGSLDDRATGVAVQSDGKIVLAGYSFQSGSNSLDFAVARYLSTPAPIVGPITAPLDPVQVNATVSASAPFTDSDVADTHTAVWNWGDGGASSGTVTETCGSGSVSGSHTYTTAGVYTITLTVTDNHGATGQSVFEYVVIYDPSAGFVTGGGWVNSPAGAYVPNPSVTGKANFGFVSKYQKGANTPTGNTEFQFHEAGFNFSSTSYDWLVVGGARSQYKGTGTVNGSGTYGFLLTAIDGALPGGGGQDKFRIKVWDKASGNVVYDNQQGASDTGDPTTVIGGGNIVIHASNQLLDGAPLATAHPDPLTVGQVQAIEREAVRRWVVAGADSVSFQGVHVYVVDLPGTGLGLTAADTVWLDRDAAGHGWFVDSSPADDREFAAGRQGPAYGKIDLLTVLAHELGHVLGIGELANPSDVMFEYLHVGVRKVPTMADVVAAGLVPESRASLPGQPRWTVQGLGRVEAAAAGSGLDPRLWGTLRDAARDPATASLAGAPVPATVLAGKPLAPVLPLGNDGGPAAVLQSERPWSAWHSIHRQQAVEIILGELGNAGLLEEGPVVQAALDGQR
jgi:uncharacterized delta-60 repeat protein